MNKNGTGEFPFELNGKVEPQLYKRLTEVFSRLQQLEQQQAQAPAAAKAAVVSQLQVIGLLGPLGQPLLGSTTTDPQLQNLQSGSVTSITVTGDPSNGLNVSGSPITTNGTITLTFGATINVATSYKVAGTQVVGARGAAVADATGAGDVVAQLNAWLARARAHGLIA